MQTLKIYKNLYIVSAILILIGCITIYSNLNQAELAGFYDVKYLVEYSPDSTFNYISNRFEFYDRVRNKYYLKPEQVQTNFWLGKGSGLYGSQSQRFGRIKGIINDSAFYLTTSIEFSGCILKYPIDHFNK